MVSRLLLQASYRSTATPPQRSVPLPGPMTSPTPPLPYSQHWRDAYPPPPPSPTSAPALALPKPPPTLKAYTSKWKALHANPKTAEGLQAMYPGMMGMYPGMMGMGGYPGMMGGMGMGMGGYGMGMGGYGMGMGGMYPGMMGGYGVSSPATSMSHALRSVPTDAPIRRDGRDVWRVSLGHR